MRNIVKDTVALMCPASSFSNSVEKFSVDDAMRV